MKVKTYKTDIPIEKCEKMWRNWPKGFLFFSPADLIRLKNDQPGQLVYQTSSRLAKGQWDGYNIRLIFDAGSSTITVEMARRIFSVIGLILGWAFLACAVLILFITFLGAIDIKDSWFVIIFLFAISGSIILCDRYNSNSTLEIFDTPIQKHFGGIPQ